VDWATLFERAAAYDVSLDAVRTVLADRRATDTGDTTAAVAPGSETGADSGDGSPGTGGGGGSESAPSRVVADADVLATDLLVGGDSRAALDHVRAHSWVVVVASDGLLDDAEAVVATLAGGALAADWRDRIERERERVTHPAGDHPALASALHGGAMHVLTLDEALQSAGAGAAIRAHVETSVKDPAAFARLFDPARLYPAVADGTYSGPDRDPRN
jgi:hypothetical protein